MLLTLFGVDVRSTPPRTLPWFREPKEEQELERLVKIHATYCNCCRVIGKIMSDVLPLPEHERGPAATQVVLQAAEEFFPQTTALIMKLSPSEGLQEATNLSLAAWVTSKVSLATNKRLRAMLNYETANDTAAESVLRDLLPGQVWIAADGIERRAWETMAFLGAAVYPLTGWINCLNKTRKWQRGQFALWSRK